jgi:abequosyltransferase
VSVRLSICIPTYNRARFIGEALESIVAQATDDVEIVISDNASTDGTGEIVAAFAARFPRIRYACWNANVGFDRNVMRVVELATGGYCWFLGSDDRIEPGAVAAVLGALGHYPGLGGMCLGYVEYNRDMTASGTRFNPTLGRYSGDTLFEDLPRFVEVLGYYLGYFSGQVVNRELFMEVASTGKWQDYCDGFVHIYMLGMCLKSRPRWLFLREPCVSKRVNDELLAELDSFYERLRFDVVRGDRVARAVFGAHSREYRALSRAGVSIHISTQVIHGKQTGLFDARSLVRLALLCLHYYYRYPEFWFKALPVMLLPASLIGPVRAVYQATLKRFLRPR